LRGNGLLNHDDLRLRLRGLLVLLIGAKVIIVVGISAEKNRNKATLSAQAIVPEGLMVIARRPADCRKVREIESQTRDARKTIKTERIGGGNESRGHTSTR